MISLDLLYYIVGILFLVFGILSYKTALQIKVI